MTVEALDQAEAAAAILLDWDGCLVEGGALKPGGRAFLRAFAGKISVLSNNSTDAPARLAAFLARAGAPVPERRIHLAGQAALEHAAQACGGAPVLLLANTTMTRQALRLGLELDRSGRAEMVVLMRDTSFSYRKLERAVSVLRRGGRLVVANPDRVHPMAGGVAPETGALLAAIAACLDLDQVETTVIGKPASALFERALAVAGIPAAHALMIGDNPDTDIAGARRLGIPAVLVGGPGGASLETIAAAAARRQGSTHARS